jgi:hypothetical protein
LVIPSTEEGFLEVDNVFEFVGILFASVLEVEAFGEDFSLYTKDGSKMIDPINDKSDEDYCPKESAFSFSEVIVESKIVDTLDSGEHPMTENPCQDEGSEDFFSVDSDSLSLGPEGVKWGFEGLLNGFGWGAGESELFRHGRKKYKLSLKVKIWLKKTRAIKNLKLSIFLLLSWDKTLHLRQFYSFFSLPWHYFLNSLMITSKH